MKLNKALLRYASHAREPWDPGTIADIMQNTERIERFRCCNARLHYADGWVILVSYNTPVALADAVSGQLVSLTLTRYSNTTTRQVRWFLQDICHIKNP